MVGAMDNMYQQQSCSLTHLAAKLLYCAAALLL
jgi:hypothetical protein